MKDQLIKILKFVFFLGIGLFLFWLIYRDQNIQEIREALRHVDYRWLWISALLGLFSHISRAVRWGLLIETAESKPHTANTFMAVMVGYLANLALPRLGEVSRCGVLTRYEKKSFTKLIGTVVIERTIDMAVVLLLTAVVILTQMDVVSQFLNNNPMVKDNLGKITQFSGWHIALMLVLAGMLAAYFVFRDYLRQLALYKKVKNIVLGLWDGIRSILRLQKKGWFLFHTLFIWLMYYLMLYVAFSAFSFTQDYSMQVALTVFVMSTYGMVAPVQGGIGAWHFMVIATLFVYGLPDSEAKIFALVLHALQTLMLIVLGLASLIALPLYNKDKQLFQVSANSRNE